MARNLSSFDKISVVVPVYNEIEVIGKFHAEILSSLKKLKYPFELIYVDDNSTDGTREFLHSRISSNIILLPKEGKKGKAYSLIEGFKKAAGSVLVMIDADLQYPPSAIKQMLKKIPEFDLVIADRQYSNVSTLRRTLSKAFRFLTGIIFGLPFDIQSGLKVFKKETFAAINFTPSSQWAFDLEFLYRAVMAGFRPASVPVLFNARQAGVSKLNLSFSMAELALNALMLRFKALSPVSIPPLKAGSMLGAGYGFRRKKYITHTTLHPSVSAVRVFTTRQILIGLAVLGLVFGFFIYFPLVIAQILAAIFSLLYFFDSAYNLYLVINSLRLRSASRLLQRLPDKELPVYTILCPLYREANIVPQFLKSIARLDWPAKKLDVVLLLEKDDHSTISKINSLKLPAYVRKVIVPYSEPLTKPKACNYGLSVAKGEYLVIYDAEDIPDPLQLRKAYSAFRTLPSDVLCVQAKLNFYNPGQNLLTRFFTAEYSLWFDLTLTGLQSIDSIIPLGGTSNHFRTRDLIALQGWDPFNVTEDADLGVRLFKRGYRTAIIDSTTLEEANSNLGNWIRQRSRWIKGYMQTWLVHTRDSGEFLRRNGLRKTILFHLTVGGKILFLLLNPFMWITLILYFTFYDTFGPIIEIIFRPPMLYIAVTCWLFGNFFFLYSYMIACAKRDQWAIIKYVYLIPLYWVMMSYAAMVALIQLFIKPHFWEKTVHGLHLGNAQQPAMIYVEPAKKQSRPSFILQSVRHAKSRLSRLTAPAFLGGNTASAPINPEPSDTVKGGRASYHRLSRRGTVLHWKSLLTLYLLAFFGLDIIAMRIFAPTPLAAAWLYLSLTGKLIYIIGQITGFSVLRAISRGSRDLKEKSKIIRLVFSTFLVSWTGVVLIGFRADPAINSFLLVNLGSLDFALPSFLVAMLCFTLSNSLVFYHLRRNVLSLYLISCLSLIFQIAMIIVFRDDLARLVQMTLFIAGSSALATFFLQFNPAYIPVLENNLSGFFGLLYRRPARTVHGSNPLSILIFNWRDTRHKYAGGAEVYVHELARRWVAEGSRVTLFCGNDQDNKAIEEIDGVEVIRRGGTYTVYLFAFIYYILKFRGKYDLIVDCENGIPFFTPLFVKKPVILIIYHVHQDIIRKYIKFPLNLLVSFLERRLMPFVYRSKKVITISPSSKKDIIKLGFTRKEDIEIVYCGTSMGFAQPQAKTPYPSFVYLGRLQDYKNVDVAIMAFSKIVTEFPDARLEIAGFGESLPKLKKLTRLLGVEDKVDYLGKITNLQKEHLLSRSWAAIQPSEIEGWGITVIEANACGTPVIASRVNGLRDSVVDSKTGLLVQSRDVFGFASAMSRIARNPQFRIRLSENALAWSRNFSWDRSAASFYSVIVDIIGSNPTEAIFAPVPKSNL